MKSRGNPEKYLTIIIDGMEQAKTNVPLICQQTKSTQNLWRMRTHLTGAQIYMKAEKGKMAFDLLQWPHDSNLTISVLLAILQQVRSKLGALPKIVYLQLDNTSRENKDKYLLSFLAHLVDLKLFKKVYINPFAGSVNYCVCTTWARVTRA